MNVLMKFLRRPPVMAAVAFTGIYAIALAMIFWGAWSLDKVPVAPDCATTFPVNDMAVWAKSFLCGKGFIPSDVMHFIGGMYFWVELQFAIPAYLAALGVAFYLRGRGLSYVASYGGGAAFGLMGYCFTLFSAGHLGWFLWMAYGPFAFGLTDRAVRKGKWFNWVMLGAVLAWGSARQPDLWLMFTLLTFAYGVWCLIRERRELKWSRVFAGVGVCAAVALVVGTPQFTHAIAEDIAGRKSQISAASSSNAKSGEEGKSETAEEKEKARREQWLFCTSWSLPPEDTLEFAFAEIHGGSNDPRIFQKPGNKPYSGRLGQHGIVPPGAVGRHPVTGKQLRAGDEFWMPYRQHSLYFGLISLVFAGAGCAGWFMLRKRSEVKQAWADAPFWMCAAAVVYMCALGGFTPFYKLVFALPFGDLMRCPVKFVHLLEFAAAVMAGYGIDFVRVRFGNARSWMTPALAVLAAVNVFDLARVDAKYLAVQDVSFRRAANDAAKQVSDLGGGKVYVAVPPQEGGQLIRDSFGDHLVQTADGRDSEGVRFVLAGATAMRGDAAIAEQMKNGTLTLAGKYSLSQKAGICRAEQGRAVLALLQVAGVPNPQPADEPAPNRVKQFFGILSILSTLAIVLWSLAYVFRTGHLSIPPPAPKKQ